MRQNYQNLVAKHDPEERDQFQTIREDLAKKAHERIGKSKLARFSSRRREGRMDRNKPKTAEEEFYLFSITETSLPAVRGSRAVSRRAYILGQAGVQPEKDGHYLAFQPLWASKKVSDMEKAILSLIQSDHGSPVAKSFEGPKATFHLDADSGNLMMTTEPSALCRICHLAGESGVRWEKTGQSLEAFFLPRGAPGSGSTGDMEAMPRETGTHGLRVGKPALWARSDRYPTRALGESHGPRTQHIFDAEQASGSKVCLEICLPLPPCVKDTTQQLQ